MRPTSQGTKVPQCVVFCVHMYSFAGLIRRTPPPTFSDATLIPLGKIVRTRAAGGSRTLVFLRERQTPCPLGQALRFPQLLLPYLMQGFEICNAVQTGIEYMCLKEMKLFQVIFAELCSLVFFSFLFLSFFFSQMIFNFSYCSNSNHGVGLQVLTTLSTALPIVYYIASR